MSGSDRLRAAISAYVRGRDRGWTIERKLAPGSSDAGPEPEFGPVPSPPRFGVGVPDRLDFRRGPASPRPGVAGAEHSGNP